MLQLKEQRVVSTAPEGSASTADEAAFCPRLLFAAPPTRREVRCLLEVPGNPV